MVYLKDTCVLIKKFDALKMIKTVSDYSSTKDVFGLTDIVKTELYPGKSVDKYDAQKSQGLLMGIKILESSNSHSFETYLVNSDPKYCSNFKGIRKRFYGHLVDRNYVKKALENGEITKEQYKDRTYIYKDYGECSCIAVAMENPKDVIIVSDDKGKVFLKPNINLFEKYKKSHNIQVLNYQEWEDDVRSKGTIHKHA